MKAVSLFSIVILTGMMSFSYRQQAPWQAPADANKLVNPIKNNVTATKAGEDLFEAQCSACHGTTGKGDGMAGANLSPHLLIILSAIGIVIIGACGMQGCKTPDAIAMKSGAQLWGENCNRCHNAPDPHIYSDDQWDAVMEHMRTNANLTNTEVQKVVAFLKSAN